MLEAITRRQHGIVSNKQAIDAGMTRDAIRSRLRSGRWRLVYRGIYATFTGELPRAAAVWAAILACGEGAVASHETAAELWGIGEPVGDLHITVPVTRKVVPPPGVTVHRSKRLPESAHPTKSPPRTRVEETVLDLVVRAKTADEVIGLVAVACVRRLTTPARLARSLSTRPKMRWREAAMSAVSDIADGCQSPLEVRYFRDVESAHELPRGRRQHPDQRANGGRLYNDVRYVDFGVVIELDGRVNHPLERRFADLQRDNSAGLRGDAVLHFGWSDVSQRACITAGQVARLLNTRGWSGTAGRCGRKCVIMEV